jgi:iron complex outermembrane recepter protein
VLDHSDLERQNVVGFADYMTLIPSLSDYSSGAAGHGVVVMRGLTTGYQQSSPTVGFYVDEVPFTASGPSGVGGIITPDPDLSDVDHIEALKGPQSTLYGASALGGIIKIVTIKPDLDNFGGTIRIDGSVIDHGGAGGGLKAAVNIPIITDVLAIRINGFSRVDPGWMRNVQDNIDNTNSTLVDGGKIAVRWKPSDSVMVDVSALDQHLHVRGYANEDDNVSLTPLYGIDTYSRPVNPQFTTDYTLVNATVNWNVGFGTVTNALSYGSYLDKQRYDFTDAYGPFATVTPPANTYTQFRAGPIMHKVSEELRFSSDRIGDFEYQGGVFYTHEADNYPVEVGNALDGTVNAPSEALTWYISNGPSIYQQYAAFADVTYYLSDKLDITVGGRDSYNSDTSSSVTSGQLYADIPEYANSSSHDNDVNYLATLRWHPLSNIDAYIRSADAYRPGGPQLQPVPGTPPTFKPDTVDNYEVGLKGRWLNQTLTTNLDYYYINWKNIQLNYLVGGLTVLGNAGKAVSKGLEFDSQYAPFTGLILSTAEAYDNARIGVNDPGVGAVKGDRLPFTPEVTATAAADYSHPINADIAGSAGLTVRYQGSKYSSFSEDPLDTSIKIPGYTLVDVRTGVSYQTFTYSFRIQNLFDRRGIDSVVNNRIFPGQDVAYWATVVRPRTFSMSIQKSF